MSGVAWRPEPIVVGTGKGSPGVVGKARDQVGNVTRLEIDDITVDPAVN